MLYRVIVRVTGKYNLLDKLGFRKREFAPFRLGHPSINVSIPARHHSPGWYWQRPPGLVSSFAQRGWRIRPCANPTVTWRSPLDSFHSTVIRPLWAQSEDYMLRVLHGIFFVLETSSVCSNVIPTMSSCVCSVLCESWRGQKEFHKGEKFFSYQLVAFFKHKLIVNIKTERMWLSSSEVGKRWVRVSSLVRVRNTDQEWLERGFWASNRIMSHPYLCLRYFKAFFSFRILLFMILLFFRFI